jgi:hypothetical protein
MIVGVAGSWGSGSKFIVASITLQFSCRPWKEPCFSAKIN